MTDMAAFNLARILLVSFARVCDTLRAIESGDKLSESPTAFLNALEPQIRALKNCEDAAHKKDARAVEIRTFEVAELSADISERVVEKFIASLQKKLDKGELKTR